MSYVCRHNVGLDFHCFTCEKEVANYIDELLTDDEIDDDNYKKKLKEKQTRNGNENKI